MPTLLLTGANRGIGLGFTRAYAADGWVDDTRYTWAVCEPTTGEMLAEVALDPVSGHMSSRARPGFEDVAAISEDTVRRYASAALGLQVHT